MYVCSEKHFSKWFHFFSPNNKKIFSYNVCTHAKLQLKNQAFPSLSHIYGYQIYEIIHEYIFHFKIRIFVDKAIVLSDCHPKFKTFPPTQEITTGKLSFIPSRHLTDTFTYINWYTEKICLYLFLCKRCHIALIFLITHSSLNNVWRC